MPKYIGLGKTTAAINSYYSVNESGMPAGYMKVFNLDNDNQTQIGIASTGDFYVKFENTWKKINA